MAAGFSMQIEQGNTNDDVYAFEKVVKRFVAAAHQNPAISTAFSYYGAHTPSYTLTVDREKCEKLGVNISDVFTSLSILYGQFACKSIHSLQPYISCSGTGRHNFPSVNIGC